MKFTGTNILYTPQVSQATYLFKNIVVNSTGTYRIGTSHTVLGVPTQITGSNTGWLFHLQAGRVFDPSGKFVSTYNTGEPFSISGWVDFSSTYRYLQMGQIISRSPESVATSGLLRALTIYCPTGVSSGSMSCDIRWLSTRIVSSGSLNNYYIHSQMTGYIFSSLGQYVNSGDFQFYKSYETLLTGSPLIAFVNTTNFPATPVRAIYNDNDSSSQNNSLTFDFQYGTTYGAEIKEYKIQRTGLYSTGLTQLFDLNTDTGFSGLFGGLWSGTRLIYQDQPNTLFLEYYLSLTDSRGNPFSTSGTFNVSIPTTGRFLTGEYISGFQLTASGEYLNPPLIAVTGYYYCTGIQQSIGSLLFSSGCTGDLSVTFSAANNQGTGASGTLQTQATTFSGLYFGGNKTFRTVYNYLTNVVGTGYTMAPRAIVNTGQYGAQCFDVPLASGYNQAWYAPFNTSGAIDVEAGWFTGVALVTTGLVSGGLLTGYLVTGIDVYNIGTGYSNRRPPLISFIRTGENGLTKNASGTLFTNTGSLNSVSKWSVEAGVPGLSPIFSGGFSGSIPLINNNLMYIKIVTTGLDITVPITGCVSVSMTNVSPPITILTPFVYSKYFDTGTYALKKKYNAAINFSINDDLSFLLTQDDLDTLYSSAGYLDNTSWPWDIGDFDF
jgi:hypothetical protein